jgi:hypothetical protein
MAITAKLIEEVPEDGYLYQRKVRPTIGSSAIRSKVLKENASANLMSGLLIFAGCSIVLRMYTYISIKSFDKKIIHFLFVFIVLHLCFGNLHVDQYECLGSIRYYLAIESVVSLILAGVGVIIFRLLLTAVDVVIATKNNTIWTSLTVILIKGATILLCCVFSIIMCIFICHFCYFCMLLLFSLLEFFTIL